MDRERYITVEQMEEATASLLENGKKVGADSWQQRVKNQTPHCGFGEAGTCCRICSMGPCRITPKAPRGICGCDVHGIVGRNYLRFTAGGSATHSDHGREICHTLYNTKEGGNYTVKDPEKLKRIAQEWGIETEGKDIFDLAHEVAETGLMEYGKPFGVQRFLKRAPEHTQKPVSYTHLHQRDGHDAVRGVRQARQQQAAGGVDRTGGQHHAAEGHGIEKRFPADAHRAVLHQLHGVHRAAQHKAESGKDGGEPQRGFFRAEGREQHPYAAQQLDGKTLQKAAAGQIYRHGVGRARAGGEEEPPAPDG